MSSIYRKGRDGYFYYQTYVYNSESGRKDKRIFHSLSTKDEGIAKKKQIELDKKYEKKQEKRGYLFWFKIGFGLILFLLITELTQRAYWFSSNATLNDPLKITEIEHQKKAMEKRDLNLSEDPIKELNKINSKNNILKSIIDENEFSLKQKIKLQAPTYTIEKIELLSDVFEQGKICVTVDQNTDAEKMQLLCEKIVLDFPEFSNLVICIYSDSKIGKELANGNDFGITNYEKKASWLAMYTNNNVEGAYFDDDPTRYLGL